MDVKHPPRLDDFPDFETYTNALNAFNQCAAPPEPSPGRGALVTRQEQRQQQQQQQMQQQQRQPHQQQQGCPQRERPAHDEMGKPCYTPEELDYIDQLNRVRTLEDLMQLNI